MATLVDGVKRCPRCTETLPGEAFAIDRSTKDGLRCYCRKCESSNEQRRATRLKREATEEWQARRRAAYFKAQYGLTPEAYQALLEAAEFACEICGGEVHADYTPIGEQRDRRRACVATTTTRRAPSPAVLVAAANYLMTRGGESDPD